jgi:hypothetical protein
MDERKWSWRSNRILKFKIWERFVKVGAKMN